MNNFTYNIELLKTLEGIPQSLDIRMRAPMSSSGGYNWWWAVFNKEDAEDLADAFENLAENLRKQAKELKSIKVME